MEIEIELDDDLMERLLLCAAEQGLSVEELIIQAIEDDMKRGGSIG